MRKALLPIALSLSLVLGQGTAWGISIDAIPNPRSHNSWVSDVANVISEEKEQAIDRTIDALREKFVALQDKPEIAVVTVPDISGYPDIETFANSLAHSWGVGNRETNNGLVIVTAQKEHKWRVETGYGLESILPDSRTYQEFVAAAVPSFKQGDFGQGLVNVVDRYAAILTPQLPQGQIDPETAALNTGLAYLGIFVILLLGVYFLAVIAREARKNRQIISDSDLNGSNGSGGGGGNFISTADSGSSSSAPSTKPSSKNSSSKTSYSSSDYGSSSSSDYSSSGGSFGGGDFGGGGSDGGW